MTTFNPKMLSLARKRRGLKKSELAALADLTPKSISDYEKGITEPLAPTMERLAKALSVPTSFFESVEVTMPAVKAVSFRAMTSMTASQRDAAIGSGAIAIALCRWIEARFALPAVDVPDFQDMEPETAAAAVREQWGLGVKPIRNMIHLLEQHGVRVFSLAEKARELDAFSLWNDQRPFCFLNNMKSVEHSRFDCAHELGHLVMHRSGGKTTGRPAERQANAFASAFLMPRPTVIASVARGTTLSRLVSLKQQWGVSVAALAYRAHSVGVINDWQYRNMCMEMSQNGYRTSEPEPIETRESSQVLNKVFTALRAEGVSKAQLARELSVYVHDIDAVVFGLTILSVERGGNEGGKKPSSATLRLVSSAD